jgi:hypothetical protein
MPEKLYPPVASFFANEERFFVAISRPLSEESCDRLRALAKTVLYPGGGQVFVYERNSFGETAIEQNDRVVDFTYESVRAEGIMPDVAVHPLSELKRILHERTK